MTSCALLGMHTFESQPSSVYYDQQRRRHQHHHDDDDGDGDIIPHKRKLAKLMKRVDTQMTTITRMLTLIVVLEMVRIIKS